ncbi:hypothetical protein K461DRAFT_272873 [Myriangium duriaei CBS 260.36]|uniref:Uncharacterized protein n=1 Tax=Myriangium duriaei CBS 260.36 TaxID=1168546 RepID=A0A9P4JBW2_9PEZI|nr:hypothetical protein K461DRAFT_272873 [Myriangium duriaei CBS 260.36]
MPSKDGDPIRRKSRRDEDSPKASPRGKEKDRDKDRSTNIRKKTLRRRSSPDAEVRSGSPDPSRMSRSSMSDLPSRLKGSAVESVPEMGRRVSLGDSKTSAYPTFSKEHSREAVRPKDEPARPKVSIPTPVPTEGGKSERAKQSTRNGAPTSGTRAPPSPPLTSDEGDIKRTGSANSSRRSYESPAHDTARRSADSGARPRPAHLKADAATSPRKASKGDDSDSSARTVESARSTPRRYASGSQIHRDVVDRDRSSGAKKSSAPSSTYASPQHTNADAQARSVAHGRKSPAAPAHPDASPVPFSQRKETATQPPRPSSSVPELQQARSRAHSQPVAAVPPTPPPPRPTTTDTPATDPPQHLPFVESISEAPRVDYLLLNGGLPYLIPRSLIPITKHPGVHPYQQYSVPQPSQITSSVDAAHLFSPVIRRLDDLNKVLTKHGSVAVATGYRSVARRLLDRLEHVFARNISSEKCYCILCKASAYPDTPSEEDMGVSWGEILEFVSGRRELPPWPPFTFDPATGSLEINGKVDKPMQKLDPDVPDEYRQHYMRQNDKTKRSVQDWLAGQTNELPQVDPPREVDDETLAFAMLTRLDPATRPLFTALMKGQTTLPASRSTTPTNDETRTDSTIVEKTSLSLQRLYRLNSRPRKPECTLYLLNNPHLHGMLATLAAISPGEWDILVSGRFDGFLWSGAEPQFPPASSHPTQAPPRGTTPLSRVASPHTPFSPRGSPLAPSRNQTLSPGPPRFATPFSAAGSSLTSQPPVVPVQLDEDTEIAVLSELERSIYRDMELLEDAFEALHQRAEGLRGALRARAAGLTSAAEARQAVTAEDEGTERPDTVIDDEFSELAPDDSASNISFARRSRRGAERRAWGGGTAAEKRRR